MKKEKLNKIINMSGLRMLVVVIVFLVGLQVYSCINNVDPPQLENKLSNIKKKRGMKKNTPLNKNEKILFLDLDDGYSKFLKQRIKKEKEREQETVKKNNQKKIEINSIFNFETINNGERINNKNYKEIVGFWEEKKWVSKEFIKYNSSKKNMVLSQKNKEAECLPDFENYAAKE